MVRGLSLWQIRDLHAPSTVDALSPLLFLFFPLPRLINILTLKKKLYKEREREREREEVSLWLCTRTEPLATSLHTLPGTWRSCSATYRRERSLGGQGR